VARMRGSKNRTPGVPLYSPFAESRSDHGPDRSRHLLLASLALTRRLRAHRPIQAAARHSVPPGGTRALTIVPPFRPSHGVTTSELADPGRDGPIWPQAPPSHHPSATIADGNREVAARRADFIGFARSATVSPRIRQASTRLPGPGGFSAKDDRGLVRAQE